MKKIFALLSALLLFTGIQNIAAQTAEEIIESYLETIGGKENLIAIKNAKMTCTGKAQGMELAITMYQKAPGLQRMDMVFQGKEITQMSFDGKEGWSTNFMTMEAEKWDAEQSEIMKSEMDFPDVFLNYNEKEYTLSLEGEETIEGAECFKVKLTKKPVMVDGKEEENFSYYFFDKETFVPIMQKSFAKTGQMKGQATETYLSDYDEVSGVYFAHTISQKLNGQPVFDLTINKIEVNVDMADSFFAFPETADSKDK